MSRFMRTRIVGEVEFWRAFAETGGVYFIKNDRANCIKIGYSRTPFDRLSTLQVGSPDPLRLVGLIAAPQEVEAIMHREHFLGHQRGEWFLDQDVITEWLDRFTSGQPIARLVCDFVQAKDVFWQWHEDKKTHTKHVFNIFTGQWEPPLS